MGQYDNKFNELVKDIMNNGVWQKEGTVRSKWTDGSFAPTRSVTDVQWKFDNSEVLVPTTKTFYDRMSIWEMLWIWQLKSNKLSDLRELTKRDKTIWDKWEINNPTSKWHGTIGPAYGYQLSQHVYEWKWEDVNQNHLNDNAHYKVIGTSSGDVVFLDQVDNLIQSLLKGPGSRRLLTTLWVPENIQAMALPPCVWNTQWVVWDDKLNLTVGIRSNDICVGNPFNAFQYQVLQHMIAQTVGIPVGTITFNIVDAHIYDRHIDLVANQIQEPIHEVPKLWINPDIQNFYDFESFDIKLTDKNFHAKAYDYELAE